MKIFSDDFQKTKLDVILNGIEKDGFYFCKSAINSDLINQIEIDVSKNRFSINKNWISGVYTKNQYFLTNILGCSKSFFDLVTEKKVFEICNEYMKGSDYRLKAVRYYETYGRHKMLWHTDNKVDRKFQEIPGLIFIAYMSDVNDGEFLYIKNSHKFSAESKINNYDNEFINKNFSKDIVSFPGSKGDLIIYNTYGIHRAKPIQKNKNFVRKSLFFQIDNGKEHGEPILLNTSYLTNIDKQISNFLGFGSNPDSKLYPNTDIQTLPIKHIINLSLFKLVLKSLISTIVPNFLKKIIKNKIYK